MEGLKENAVVLWDFGLRMKFGTLQLASSGQFCNLASYMLFVEQQELIPCLSLCSESQLIVVAQVNGPVASRVWLGLSCM